MCHHRRGKEIRDDCAVEGKTGKILSPCGNCRQVLSDYMPEAYVIVSQDGKVGKIKAKELLPLAYHVSY